MQDNLNQGIETKIIDTPNSSFNNELLNKNNLQEKEFWDNIVVQIKQELIVEGYSSKTIKMYLIYISDFFKYIKKEIKDLTKNDILAFLAYKKETGCDNATLSLIHAALKYLFKKNKVLFLLEDIKIPKKAKTLPKVLTRNEIKELFSKTKFGRNRLMLQFMYGSGCRVSEVTKIKVEDLNLKERTAIIRGGKGNKDRIIILSKEWIHGIKKYLNKKKIKSEFVFSKKNGKPINTDTIQRIVRETAKKAGFTKKVTPHCFRHSYATHLLETGTNIRYIQALLGHSNLNTTQIYTNVANQQLKKIQSPLDKL
ncbi:MAG: putative tyrosine recombinase XerC-like protein [archaeon ADurb.Bin336]|nr:MAG: putative tyrosine recombinase XerC-like protein [archaeon ADurb.Bin336]